MLIARCNRRLLGGLLCSAQAEHAVSDEAILFRQRICAGHLALLLASLLPIHLIHFGQLPDLTCCVIGCLNGVYAHLLD